MDTIEISNNIKLIVLKDLLNDLLKNKIINEYQYNLLKNKWMKKYKNT